MFDFFVTHLLGCEISYFIDFCKLLIDSVFCVVCIENDSLGLLF